MWAACFGCSIRCSMTDGTVLGMCSNPLKRQGRGPILVEHLLLALKHRTVYAENRVFEESLQNRMR